MNLAKCPCKHCGGNLEFEDQHDGSEVDCPHCGRATTLFVLEPNNPPVAAPPTNPNLKPCSECGHMVSKRAESCPSCGVRFRSAPIQIQSIPEPSPQKKSGCLTMFIGVILAFIILAALGSILNFSESKSGDSNPTKTRKLENVDITASATKLFIKNLDQIDWPELQVFINGTPPFTYRAWIGPIRAGETKSIELGEFAKKDGQRFNPFQYKVTQVWIGGNGYDYSLYKF